MTEFGHRYGTPALISEEVNGVSTSKNAFPRRPCEWSFDLQRAFARTGSRIFKIRSGQNLVKRVPLQHARSREDLVNKVSTFKLCSREDLAGERTRRSRSSPVRASRVSQRRLSTITSPQTQREARTCTFIICRTNHVDVIWVCNADLSFRWTQFLSLEMRDNTSHREVTMPNLVSTHSYGSEVNEHMCREVYNPHSSSHKCQRRTWAPHS